MKSNKNRFFHYPHKQERTSLTAKTKEYHDKMNPVIEFHPLVWVLMTYAIVLDAAQLISDETPTHHPGAAPK